MSDPFTGLFINRTPESAARQIAIVLVSATEYHLATLERLRERKSSAKYDIDRMTKVCLELVAQCRDLGIAPDVRGLRGFPCVRLNEELRKEPPHA